jgi:hypothetical protein
MTILFGFVTSFEKATGPEARAGKKRTMQESCLDVVLATRESLQEISSRECWGVNCIPCCMVGDIVCGRLCGRE